MSVNAFVDNGFPPGTDFCIRFLSSPEFNITTLRGLAASAPSHEKKEAIALRIAHALERGELTADKVLLTYVKQPRTWLSLKQGYCTRTPELAPSALLLREFGEEGWYGPINNSTDLRKWYIRTYKIRDYVRRGIGEASQLDLRYIRWSVIAEVSDDYVALSWDGFTFTQITDDRLDPPAQFPFWIHIPNFFDELAEHFQGQWEYPNLHQLVLHHMWNKYLNKSLGDFHYKWQHRRIRAEAAGVALNAHSAGVSEINVMGLQALSRKLAESALEAQGFSDDVEKISHVENALLRTLIKEWGTKSYEFSLDRERISKEAETEDLENKAQSKKLFRAHCYFGLKPNSTTQDSLQHLRCFSGYYGGSTSVLEFILRELRLRG
jgi:hypothetical protein